MLEHRLTVDAGLAGDDIDVPNFSPATELCPALVWCLSRHGDQQKQDRQSG